MLDDPMFQPLMFEAFAAHSVFPFKITSQPHSSMANLGRDLAPQVEIDLGKTPKGRAIFDPQDRIPKPSYFSWLAISPVVGLEPFHPPDMTEEVITQPLLVFILSCDAGNPKNVCLPVYYQYDVPLFHAGKFFEMITPCTGKRQSLGI